MDPIRHVDTDEALDLNGRLKALRATLETFVSRDGDALLVAGGLSVATDGFRHTDGAPAEARQRLSEISSTLREQSEAVGAVLEEDRLIALEAGMEEGSPVRTRLAKARELQKSLEHAFEAIAVLEETPAVELDLERLHRVFSELAAQLDEPLADPLDATYITEVSFRL